MPLVGVNGTGKTTTLGKLGVAAARAFALRVLLAAADTYRAAATKAQLEVWAARAGLFKIVTGAAGSDPGAVAFEAVAKGRADGYDVVLIDTAGRLHNQEPLMAELAKVRRVIARQLEGAPHETLLSDRRLDQPNGLRQAEQFRHRRRRRRDRADQARRQREGRRGDRDRPRARNPGQARRASASSSRTLARSAQPSSRTRCSALD